MPGTFHSFLSRFHRAIEDFRHDIYAHRPEVEAAADVQERDLSVVAVTPLQKRNTSAESQPCGSPQARERWKMSVPEPSRPQCAAVESVGLRLNNTRPQVKEKELSPEDSVDIFSQARVIDSKEFRVGEPRRAQLEEVSSIDVPLQRNSAQPGELRSDPAPHAEDESRPLGQRFSAADASYADHKRGDANAPLQIDGKSVNTVVPVGDPSDQKSAEVTPQHPEATHESGIQKGSASAPEQPVSPLQLKLVLTYPSILDRSIVEGGEAFGILRSRLLGVHSTLGMRTLLITSAEIEEGKTFVSLNLAFSLAQLGHKQILLVDSDLRKSAVTHALQMNGSPGLTDFLQNKVSFESIVRPTTSASLFIVGAGISSNGLLPEILEGSRWAEFLKCAKERFDLVVVDSLPAAAPVADFELLSAPCDKILLVVRLRKTTRDCLVLAMQRIDEKKLLGVVVNDSDQLKKYKHYGYYAHTKNAE